MSLGGAKSSALVCVCPLSSSVKNIVEVKKKSFSRKLISFFLSLCLNRLTPVLEKMKTNQCSSGREGRCQLARLRAETALKHVRGNRCAFLPLCLFPGARLRAEADAPTQREHGWCRQCGRTDGVGRGDVSHSAFPPAYCNAQQHLSTSNTASVGKKNIVFHKTRNSFMGLISKNSFAT